jgi:hypothetical protein
VYKGWGQSGIVVHGASVASRLKMYVSMSMCNKTAKKHTLSGINLNVILKLSLT